MQQRLLRRSFDRASSTSALHMVSAWRCEQRLVLAQVAADAKSNEITAIAEGDPPEGQRAKRVEGRPCCACCRSKARS